VVSKLPRDQRASAQIAKAARVSERKLRVDHRQRHRLLPFVGNFLLTNPRPRDINQPMRKQTAYAILDDLREAMAMAALDALERGEFDSHSLRDPSGRVIGFPIPEKFRAEVEAIANNRRWQRRDHI
jgi:hypothetical protein